MAKKKAAGLSENLMISAITAVLKTDKFEVREVEPTEDGTGLRFTAWSKSGQVRVTGVFQDPQQDLDLEETGDDDESSTQQQ